MSAQKRIAKVRLPVLKETNGDGCANPMQEFAEVTGNPPAGMTIGLVDESNVHSWEIIMDGPDGSPYAVR